LNKYESSFEILRRNEKSIAQKTELRTFKVSKLSTHKSETKKTEKLQSPFKMENFRIFTKKLEELFSNV